MIDNERENGLKKREMFKSANVGKSSWNFDYGHASLNSISNES